MVEVWGLPGIWRQTPGLADTDEPCTKSLVPVSLSEDPPAPRFLSCLRHRKSLMLSLPARLTVQCSVPLTSASVPVSARASSARIDSPAHAAAAAVRKERREPPASPVAPTRSVGIVGNCESPLEADMFRII